ncbi:TetR family transcriptional regulator [Chryseobacterium sp. Leaf404]|uniref:TetR/AcrR family transcriptional regulator n=1 Tax=unclassified Chryseobacterium TaxID=2593645 RepID=UPI00070023D3|nr:MULTISPECIES: TetR/AcrR family transcriptional regulator [unclassified Chryseobacterium]KQT16407.1 TetR family transcriptional regulator [Chryseobacterium sp. Leaf404]
MNFQLKFNVNENLYLKDPENSEIGKSIVKNAIELIFEMGFEQFTFKKLALKINSTEATVYRYFASKYKLLTYILNWYWSYLECIAELKTSEIKNPPEKLEKILEIITHHNNSCDEVEDYDISKLHLIVISESSKSYLVKEVDEISKEMVFDPLESVCRYVSEIISMVKPDFPYPLSLASTLLETAHDQHFFSEHLPKLTDYQKKYKPETYVFGYLKYITFNLIK